MDKNTITLTTNEYLKKKLENKLEEYQGRIKPYSAPELQMDAICKIKVLETLLKSGKVELGEAHKELSEEYGEGLSEYRMLIAFLVIKDYNDTGGEKVVGGTGLK